jgi:hypothetical protein
MKIVIRPEVMYRLMAYAAITRDEYSGFGFCERHPDQTGSGGDIIDVYDFILLDVGSFTFTEIEPARVLPLLQRPDRTKMKVWLHRHPMGNGIPGPHNWSGTDEMTIQKEPLGSTPELVNWSVSIVLTPGGFVGRIDNYKNHITQHLEVEPSTRLLVEEVAEFYRENPLASEKPRKKSRRTEEFPSQETGPSIRITGKPKKRKKKGKSGSTTAKLVSEVPLAGQVTMTVGEFMDAFGSSALNTIQSIPPLQICAPTTELTGPGNETGTTETNKEVSGK